MAEQSILQKSDCAQLINNYPLLVKCYQFGKGLEIRGAEVCTCARVSYFFLICHHCKYHIQLHTADENRQPKSDRTGPHR